MPRPPSSASSAAVLSTIALASKAFLNLTTQAYDVRGLMYLQAALRGKSYPLASGETGLVEEAAHEGQIVPEGRLPRRGIVTVCNHNSVVDDPMMWAMFPVSHFFPFARPSHTCHNMRWTLGASDIMFTSPPLSKFFTMGQVIETVRGGGIYQPAVDTAIKRVEQGGWIHIFPEGKVNQVKSNPQGGLHRFKWGVGRIIMDANIMPEIIPMWISGFDQIMNEYRGSPRAIPRSGAKISVTVGEPITNQIEPLVQAFKRGKEDGSGEEDPTATRIAITSQLQEAVRRLGEQVEHREGRFERDEWSHSRALEEIKAPV